MADSFETLREVGVALDAFRSEVTGQFTTLKWIIGGVSAVGLVVAGVLFNKVDDLEVIAARNTAILERIEQSLQHVSKNTNDIRESVQAASLASEGPSPDLFEDLKGIPITQFSNFEELYKAVSSEGGSLREGTWVYVPIAN